MKEFLVLAVSYLFGSVPWALVIGQVFFHKDIRKEGSGNLGASNAGRVLGRPVAVIVTFLDAFKAFFSMMLAAYTAPAVIPFAGLACCVGHCYPVFAHFRGGKAVATSYGYLLGLCVFLGRPYFWQFFFPILCFFAILYLCRMVSVSSILSLLAAVLVSYITRAPLSISLCLTALWCFVTWRHRSNIERVRNGTESHIKWMGEERHGKH
jgi:glycerol-3-phosphate acyltransferase PlsY